MAQFRSKKPVLIVALTFDEVIEHAIISGVPLYEGIPWSFTFLGRNFTHETNDWYLISTPEGTSLDFRRGDMLIADNREGVYPCPRDIFDEAWEPA